jgi:DNA polymerase I-like protein with 3'-5' exonuclease and polymerase domains
MLTVEDNKKFDWRNISLADCLKGNAMDTHYTAKIYYKLLEELQTKKLETLYERLISPATMIFRDMEYDGLLIDQKKLQELKADILAKLQTLEGKLKACKGLPPDINFSSSHHLVLTLFSLEREAAGEWTINEQYGFGLYPFAKTDKGQPQTNEETMVQLRDMVNEEYRRRTK